MCYVVGMPKVHKFKAHASKVVATKLARLTSFFAFSRMKTTGIAVAHGK